MYALFYFTYATDNTDTMFVCGFLSRWTDEKDIFTVWHYSRSACFQRQRLRIHSVSCLKSPSSVETELYTELERYKSAAMLSTVIKGESAENRGAMSDNHILCVPFKEKCSFALHFLKFNPLSPATSRVLIN